MDCLTIANVAVNEGPEFDGVSVASRKIIEHDGGITRSRQELARVATYKSGASRYENRSLLCWQSLLLADFKNGCLGERVSR
jgi:hypothetical protein